MKKHINAKGGTLVMLVLVVAISIIMGTGLMSVTVQGLKMKKVNTVFKENLYFSESGLEEVYAIAYKMYNLTVNQAKTDVDTELQKIANGEESNYDDEDGNLDITLIENYYKSQFKYYYIFNIKDALNYSTGGLTKENLHIDYPAGSTINITSVIPASFTNDELTINMESVFNSKDITRKINADLIIEVSDLSTSIVIDQDVSGINTNPLLNKSFTLQGNLYFQGNSNNIDGNTFIIGNIIANEMGASLNISPGNIMANYGYIDLHALNSTINADTVYTRIDDIIYNSSDQISGNIANYDVNEIETLAFGSESLYNDIGIDGLIEAIEAIGEKNPKTLPIDYLYTVNINNNILNEDYFFAATNNNDKDIYIVGAGIIGSLTKDKDIRAVLGCDANDEFVILDDAAKTYEGLVIGKGNVYIKGSVSIDGAIISYNNIYLDKNGTKNFANNSATVEMLLALAGEESPLDERLASEYNSEIEIIKIKEMCTSESFSSSQSDIIKIRNWDIGYE